MTNSSLRSSDRHRRPLRLVLRYPYQAMHVVTEVESDGHCQSPELPMLETTA